MGEAEEDGFGPDGAHICVAVDSVEVPDAGDSIEFLENTKQIFLYLPHGFHLLLGMLSIFLYLFFFSINHLITQSIFLIILFSGNCIFFFDLDCHME